MKRQNKNCGRWCGRRRQALIACPRCRTPSRPRASCNAPAAAALRRVAALPYAELLRMYQERSRPDGTPAALLPQRCGQCWHRSGADQRVFPAVGLMPALAAPSLSDVFRLAVGAKVISGGQVLSPLHLHSAPLVAITGGRLSCSPCGRSHPISRREDVNVNSAASKHYASGTVLRAEGGGFAQTPPWLRSSSACGNAPAPPRTTPPRSRASGLPPLEAQQFIDQDGLRLPLEPIPNPAGRARTAGSAARTLFADEDLPSRNTCFRPSRRLARLTASP